jgi:hypothetical protein
MIYSAPELGSEGPSVKRSGGEATTSASKTAKRQQARANPNRGNRGNRATKGKGKK